SPPAARCLSAPAGPAGRVPQPRRRPPPGRPPSVRPARRAPLHARRRARCPGPCRDRSRRRWRPGRRAARRRPPGPFVASRSADVHAPWEAGLAIGWRLATLGGRFLAAAEKAGQQLVERDQVVGASRVDQRGREADGPILASRHEDRGGGWVTGAELGGDSTGLARWKVE